MNEQGLESLNKIGFFLGLLVYINKINYFVYEVVTEPKKIKPSLNLRNTIVQEKPQRFRHSLDWTQLQKFIRMVSDKSIETRVEVIELLVPEGTLRLRTPDRISGTGVNIFGLNIDIFVSNKTDLEKVIISNKDFKLYSNNFCKSFIGKENANMFTVYSSDYIPRGKPTLLQGDHISREDELWTPRSLSRS